MPEVAWAPSFRRAFRHYTRRHSHTAGQVADILRRLAEDPFAPGLDTHKLRGTLEGLWACSVECDCRIVFDLVKEPGAAEQLVLLVDIGTHEEVY